MTPEQASRVFPLFVGLIFACITAGALVAGDGKLASAGAVGLVLVLVVTPFVRIRQRRELEEPPED